MIDTGISRAYVGKATAWECRAGRIFEVTKDGRHELLSGLMGVVEAEEGVKVVAAGGTKLAPPSEAEREPSSTTEAAASPPGRAAEKSSSR